MKGDFGSRHTANIDKPGRYVAPCISMSRCRQNMETGDVEVLVHDITVLNTPERDLPFNIRSFNKVSVCGVGVGWGDRSNCCETATA